MTRIHLLLALLGFCICVKSDYTGQEYKDMKCAVCRVLVFEINNKILSADPKATIDVGSYRLDGKGNQGTVQMNYARSETHLTEIMESICQKTSNYGQVTLTNGRFSLMPLVTTKVVSLTHEKSKFIKHLCHSLLSEHEEEITSLYTKRDIQLSSLEQLICSNSMAEVCTSKDYELSFPHKNDEIISVPEKPAEDTEDKRDTEENLDDKETDGENVVGGRDDKNDVKRDENDIKTDENDIKTDENDIKTDENDIKTDENDVKNNENDVKSDENEGGDINDDAGEEFDDYGQLGLEGLDEIDEGDNSAPHPDSEPSDKDEL